MSNLPQNFQTLQRPQHITRVEELMSVSFERVDLDRMVEFLLDFGFKAGTSAADGRRYLRGFNDLPFCIELIPSTRDSFVGFAFAASSIDALHALAQAHGAIVEQADTPGRGQRVRLFDPDGWRIDVLYDFERVVPLPLASDSTPINHPFGAERINRPVRNPVAPSPVIRAAHLVLQTPDFAKASDWYMEQFGLIPTDVQVTADGTPALGFFRLDRGSTPTDHHTLAILAGPGPKLLHASTETVGLDVIGQGQQHLLERGWQHHWGIGRHLLGSQIFDYWKDPAGDEWEHYADGDLMTDDYPTGYHPLTRGGLWAWGDDLPDGLRPPDGAGEGAPPPVKALIEALQIPARSWLP